MIPYSMDYMRRQLRVCIYARVSTEHEAQISALENQLDWYKPLLDYHPEWTLVERYIDEGITGTSAEKRGEFMRMIEDAKKHKFDMILTREVSRFARNTVDTLQYTRMLKEHGVEVYFINDGIKTFDGDGELRLTIMATLAQDESRKTSIRVKSGQQTSMNNGVYYGNGNILGYTRVETLLADKTKLVDYVIDPEQAETVRMIFDLYLDGYGLVKIKDELELHGRKTSQGKDKWFPTVISHVLKNSFYCGIMTYHKEYTPDYLKQKKVKNYGEMEFTQAQGKHEPIVTVEEFERVQRIMELKRTSCKNLNTGRTKGKKPSTTVWGKLTVLQYALSQYTCPKEGEDVPESVIEAYFSKIVVKKDGFDWYIRINGNPDKPLHCKLEGKRRSTTKVVVTQDFSPALDSSTTGCYQNWGGLICTSSFPSVTRKLLHTEKPRVSI